MEINNDTASAMLAKISAKGGNAKQREEELKKVCADFESMFLQKMMQTMRQSSIESEFTKKSNGEKIFTDMLDAEYTSLAAKSGTSGLGESLFNHLKQTMPEFREVGNNFPYNTGKNKPTGNGIDIAY